MKKRIYFLDTVRGVLIIGVVLYHIFFDLYNMFGVEHFAFINSIYADIVRDFGAGALIFISGISSRLSKSNVKRGIKAIFFALVLSVVTYFADCFIFFGIIHFMGVAMLLYGLLENVLVKFDGKIAILVTAILGAVGIYVFAKGLYPAGWGNNIVAYILGFDNGKYLSWDYFPILNWIFVFICGTYVGKYFKEGKIPSFFYANICKPITFVGRYTIWIYLLHQPIAMGIMMLIFE